VRVLRMRRSSVPWRRSRSAFATVSPEMLMGVRQYFPQRFREAVCLTLALGKGLADQPLIGVSVAEHPGLVNSRNTCQNSNINTQSSSI
jgi:hypothetical protein